MASDEKAPVNNFPHTITFRLADDTVEQLKKVAGAHGMTHHKYAQALTLRGLGTQVALPAVKVRVVAADVLKQLSVEHVRQGTNVNQIARAVNQGDHGALANLPEWFATSRELLGRIADALGTTRDP
jgi:hypothetical protein